MSGVVVSSDTEILLILDETIKVLLHEGLTYHPHNKTSHQNHEATLTTVSSPYHARPDLARGDRGAVPHFNLSYPITLYPAMWEGVGSLG